MTTVERQNKILEILETTLEISVKDLSSKLSVSEVTIRKDLSFLELNGALERKHGKARHKEKTSQYYDLQEEIKKNYSIKQKIAQVAFDMVEDKDVVLIGSGSTCALIAEKLCKKKNIIIITNSICLYSRLSNIEARIIFLGGEYAPDNGSVFGTFALDALKTLNIDKFFLGTTGADLKTGLTSFNLSDHILQQTMINSAKEVILVADHTKFGHISAIKIAEFSDIDTVISDLELCDSISDNLKISGINLIKV